MLIRLVVYVGILISLFMFWETHLKPETCTTDRDCFQKTGEAPF